MENTTYLALPYLVGSQDQKHITHNEALRILDAVVQLSVQDRGLATPPADPSEGDRYIVASEATDAWQGWENSVAAYLDGGWTRLIPNTGWFAWVDDEEVICVYDGTGWTRFSDFVVEGGVGQWGINTDADQTNRLAVKSDAVLVSHDDVTPGTGDVQVKINKSAEVNTGSFLFQTNWSGRAEMGLAGEDDFSFKVSADGASWKSGFKIAADTGLVSFPSGVNNIKPKNWIINGGFTVNQRGGTRTPGIGAYGYDRWKGHADGLEQVIEDLPAGDYTLTFDSASDGAGTIGGTTATSPIYVTGLARGDQSIIVPSDATRVSVCAGDCRYMADPFEERTAQQEEWLCKRYYVRFTANSNNAPFAGGVCYGASDIFAQFLFQDPMRVAPTAASSGAFEALVGGAVKVASAVSIGSISKWQAQVNLTVSNAPVGDGALLRMDAGAYLEFDAEF